VLKILDQIVEPASRPGSFVKCFGREYHVWIALLLLLAVGNSWVAAQTLPNVRILNTRGMGNPKDWVVVTGTPDNLNPRHVVLENGRIRLMHPPTEVSEKAGHVLYLNLGGVYRMVGDPEYGDWTYTGSSFTDPVTKFEILQNTPLVARIRLHFDQHVHEYQDGAPFPVRKTLVLHRGSWGYRAILSVQGDLPGEREVGFGGTTTHLFSYTNKKAILWNPFNPPPQELFGGTDYEWIRDEGQQMGDWWAASIPFTNSHYRFVAVRPPNLPGIRTGQFSSGNTGHLIHWAFEGLPQYEAFIAAVPYNASMARRVTVRNGVASVHAPQAGYYSLYTRSVSGRRHTYDPAVRGMKLNAGWNSVNVRGVALNAPVVVPVTNGVNLPGDIFRLYYNKRWD